MPWNWTVQNNTLPSYQQDCKALSGYLSIYAVEHFFWLFATFLAGWFRLRIGRHKEENDRNVVRYLLLYTWTGVKFWQRKDKIITQKIQLGQQFQPSITD